MVNRFANQFNSCGSCAAANESVSASSSCTRAAQRANTALLLTMDNAVALSIFAIISAIIIRLLGVIILGGSFSRPVWATAH